MFGLAVTFSNDNSTLLVTAPLDCACPLDMRSESAAVVYGLASVIVLMLLTVLSGSGSCLNFATFSKILNAALDWMLRSDFRFGRFYCTASSPELVQLMNSTAVIKGWSYVIIKNDRQHERLYCSSTCRLAYRRGVITKWRHKAEITDRWQQLRCWCLYNLKDLSVLMLKTVYLTLITEWTNFLQKLPQRHIPFLCVLCLQFVMCCIASHL